LILFASRHASQTARPAFLSHVTGNWGNEADFGGNSRELNNASALLFKAGFLSLSEQYERSNLKHFELDIEVTHHGPTTLKRPILFMELGSSKDDWIINDAGKVVSNAIIEAIFKYINFTKIKNQKIGVGFGGMHYAPQFKKLVLETNIALSHICPKYHIKELNNDLIAQIINKTMEKIDFFIIDWKGINSEEKKHLIPMLETFNIPIKKTKDF